MSIMYVDSPIGALTLGESGGVLTHLHFGKCEIAGMVEEKADILTQAARQLAEYFARKRKEFKLPINAAGTPFQQAVWRQLQNIPYGTTTSYAQLAQAVGSPRGFRAVGMANNKNPIAIILPCHRVIGSNGTLTGYGGGLHIKEWLLKLES